MPAVVESVKVHALPHEDVSLFQIIHQRRHRAAEVRQHKCRLRGIDEDAQPRKSRAEVFPSAGVRFAVCEDVLPVLRQRAGHRLGKAAQLPGDLPPGEGFDDFRLSAEIAQPHAGDAQNLGHGACDQQPGMAGNQLHHRMPGAVLDERLVHHKPALRILHLIEQVLHLIPCEGRAHRVQRVAQVDQRALEQRVLQLRGGVADFVQRGRVRRGEGAPHYGVDLMPFAQQGRLVHAQAVAGAEHLVFAEAGRCQQRAGGGKLGREIDGGDAARRGEHLRRIEVQVFGQRGPCAAHRWVGIVADVVHARRQRVPHPARRALRAQVGGVIQPVRGRAALPDVSTVVH